MINIKNTIALFCFFAITISSTFASNVIEITGVKVEDKNSINLEFSDKTLEFSPESELKIYKDLKIKEIGLNEQKLVVELETNDFLTGYDYSLISLSDMDLNIDFKLDFENKIISNDSNLVWSSLEFIDENTISIDLIDGSTTPNLKILKELKIDSLESISGDLNIKTYDDLENSNSYISMLLSLQDLSGNIIDLENSLYDFNVEGLGLPQTENQTEEVMEPQTENQTEEVMEPQTETQIEEVMEPQTETQIEEVMELQNNEYVDIEDIAMQAETTPDTGTKEIFIILMSLLLGVGYFLLSNKKA